MQGLVKSMSFSGEVKVNITFGIGIFGGVKIKDGGTLI